MSIVDLEVRGHQLWITLNRPDRKNTLVAESFHLLAQAWERVREDDGIRVAVLTASGDTDFCCGGDIQELIAPKYGDSDDPRAEAARSQDYRAALALDRPVFKPVIAAVNGRALGGGTELLGATDIRIAASHATFALPEVKIGIVPGAGSMVRVARQLPWAHAMRLMLTGEPIDAATALAWGLVSEVVPPEELHNRAEKLADIVCANAPLAVQAVKRVALETHTLPWADAFDLEFETTSAIGETADAAEGPAAFLQKRTPRFGGR